MIGEVRDAALKEYLAECAKVSALDPDRAFKITKDHVRAFNRKEPLPEPIRKLQDRWYKSLKREPDYTVYADPLYFCDLWLCWSKYSKRYLLDIQKPKSLGRTSLTAAISPRVVLDLGCGVGYTTATLKTIFPKARVIGTNIRGTGQFRIASALGKRHGFEVRGTFRGIKADLVFASEYFEHWQEPIPHLVELIQRCHPKHLLIANAFNSPSIGHFTKYLDEGEALTGKKMSLRFNRALRDLGYKSVETRLWNGRPTYWQRTA